MIIIFAILVCPIEMKLNGNKCRLYFTNIGVHRLLQCFLFNFHKGSQVKVEHVLHYDNSFSPHILNIANRLFPTFNKYEFLHWQTRFVCLYHTKFNVSEDNLLHIEQENKKKYN